MNRSSRPRRVTIERIELDLRGLAPADAEATARAVGPALARSLAGMPVRIDSTERIEAGRIASPRAPQAEALAAEIALRIAQRMGGRDD